MMLRWLLGSVLAITTVQAFAAAVLVEGVQMPAWVERDGRLIPLKVGMSLNKSDQLRTGANARVLLGLAEGSKVKLGENGTLRVDELNSGDDLFSASLKVLRGAFRFSTELLMKAKYRDVNVSIGTATIGIRGTDVWGKAADEKDIVCLLEGKISVNRGTDPTVTMQDPLTFYIAPKNKPAEMVAPVPLEKIAVWAKETDIQPAQGAAILGGKWKVYLVSAPTQQEILKAYDTLAEAGYATEIRPVTVSGVTEYQLRISNLPSRKEAESLAERLKGQAGIATTRVSR
jgi:hypothetical protein